jgi:hypothetical protein
MSKKKGVQNKIEKREKQRTIKKSNQKKRKDNKTLSQKSVKGAEKKT